jgi:phosphatidate cytidylyltransferase
MLKKSEFYNRLWVGAFSISSVALLVGFAYVPFVNFLLLAVIALLTGTGVWEYARLAKAKGLNPATNLMIGVAILEVLAFYVAQAYPQLWKLALVVIVLGFISFFLAHFRKPENALTHVAVEFFGMCYVALPFCFMVAILYPPSLHGDGRWWLLYLIVVTKVTDIGGYFVGKMFGRHPLAPHLSPRKTIEGAIGGFCFAIGVSLLFCLWGRSVGWELSFWNGTWMGAVIGILAQIGDLSESVLKRDAAVKDSSTLPGMGGVLDLLDSILFTSPVVYFFIRSM